jgi:hypothetical protein
MGNNAKKLGFHGDFCHQALRQGSDLNARIRRKEIENLPRVLKEFKTKPPAATS